MTNKSKDSSIQISTNENTKRSNTNLSGFALGTWSGSGSSPFIFMSCILDSILRSIATLSNSSTLQVEEQNTLVSSGYETFLHQISTFCHTIYFGGFPYKHLHTSWKVPQELSSFLIHFNWRFKWEYRENNKQHRAQEAI